VRAIYSLLNVHERVHHFLNIAMGLGSELAATVLIFPGGGRVVAYPSVIT
jgi:hypothetical protein